MAPTRPAAKSSLRAALVVSLGCALAALGACSNPVSGVTDPTAAQPKILTVGATLEPGTLDFTVSDAAAIGQLLLYNVYETLVKVGDDGRIRPLLAVNYTQSKDRLSYTFDLDPKAKFASGAPVDAAAVVASLERLRRATASTVQGQMEVVDKVAAVDERTVQVTLKRPSQRWLYDMTSYAGIVLDPAADDLAKAPAGSGPFRLAEWATGDHITLEKNPDYWGTPGRFDRVVFRYFDDPNAMNTAMLTGEIDIISTLTTPSNMGLFADSSRFTVLTGTTNGEIVLGFNHDRPALADRPVRQALNHAIDRQALVDTVWGGQGQLIGSMTAPTDPYYEDLSDTYPYNPDKARELLQAAGADDLTLSFRVPVVPYATGAAEFIVSALSQVGVTAVVEELDFQRWLNEVFLGGDYDMTIVAHVEPRDINRFAEPDYYWHYDNPQFQALLKTADEAATPEEYAADMRRAARLLAEDAAADWLFLLPNIVIVKAGITGVAANATSVSFDLTTIAGKG
ncbi:MAG: ABC transporter substrate-binding protein [Propionibacteriaceae bacterium]|jgi:peptide/nickel transport system substrate-binding protein|nr:ABC transporter substrate-binding protein [Propionibacteriaceae bacterium]